jgi:hypothetical protein
MRLAAIVLSSILLVPLLIGLSPTAVGLADADFGLGGSAVVVCDIAVAPTKCAGAAAYSTSGCVDANFEGPFGMTVGGEACWEVVGAAGASAAIHIPTAAHSDVAVAGPDSDTCTHTFSNFGGSSGCGAGASATGCGQAAKGAGAVTNFGPIAAPAATAKTGDCPSPPPPPPPPPGQPGRPCDPMCAEVCALVLQFADIPACNEESLNDSAPVPLSSLTQDSQERVKNAIALASLGFFDNNAVVVSSASA